MKKKNSTLNLTGNFIDACFHFNITPIEVLNNFTRYYTPVLILAESSLEEIKLACSILNHYRDGKTKGEIDEAIRTIHKKYVYHMRHLLTSDFYPDKDQEFYTLIDQWYREIEYNISSATIYTSEGIEVDIPKGLNLLASILQFSPVELIQHYIIHVDVFEHTDEDSIHTYSTKLFLISNVLTKN